MIKFGEADDAGIEEFIDVEFWLYRENTNENGFIISLNTASQIIILQFPDLRTLSSWSILLKRFTVRLNPKEDYNFSRLLGVGVSAKVYLATERGKSHMVNYAVKTIQKSYLKNSSINFQNIVREIRIHI